MTNQKEKRGLLGHGSEMDDLEEIIRRAQDRVRGRPRNWRDDLHDWWSNFSFHDHVAWPAYCTVVCAYIALMIVLVAMEIFP